MLGLPQSTEFGRRIPKQKFYDNLSVTMELKRIFIDEIRSIRWAHKLAPTTMNIEPGKDVSEVEIFEVWLNKPSLDQRILRLIDREIPYHILFVLRYEELSQLYIGYKEVNLNNTNTFKVSNYYHTDWLPQESHHIRLEGLNMDTLYSGLVRQIAGERFKTEKLSVLNSESLRDVVSKDIEHQKLETKIKQLEARIKKEKQFNRRVEMNTEIKKLKRQIEDML